VKTLLWLLWAFVLLRPWTWTRAPPGHRKYPWGRRWPPPNFKHPTPSIGD